MGSIPHPFGIAQGKIYRRAAFPHRATPRYIVHIREAGPGYCAKWYKDTRPIRAKCLFEKRRLSPLLNPGGGAQLATIELTWTYPRER